METPPSSVRTPGEPCEPPRTLALLEAWKAGDERAFAALHARFTPLLRRRVSRHAAWPGLQGRWDVEDVVQTLWANTLPNLRTRFENQGVGSLEAYLGRICDDTVVSLLRGHLAKKRGGGNDRPLATGFDSATARPGVTAPESPTGHARASELLAIAREVCNEREFEVFELIEVQGYTSEEVAFAMHDTPEAVRGVKHRAKAKIIARMNAG